MAKHNELGKMGEDLAVQYLTDKGYEILERNWRNIHKEIDIIAKDGEQMDIETRFDIVSIVFNNGEPVIDHIEDAFLP